MWPVDHAESHCVVYHLYITSQYLCRYTQIHIGLMAPQLVPSAMQLVIRWWHNCQPEIQVHFRHQIRQLYTFVILLNFCWWAYLHSRGCMWPCTYSVGVCVCVCVCVLIITHPIGFWYNHYLCTAVAYTAHTVVLTKILSQPLRQNMLFSLYCH